MAGFEVITEAVGGGDNIVGLPDWARSTYYDIQAKAPGTFTQEQMREMERSLLAKRFQFSAHWTTADRSGYVLRRVTGSTKRPQASKADGSPLDGRGAGRLTSTGMTAHGLTMQLFSTFLGEGLLGKPVENETDLTGGYDFELTFERPNLSAAAAGDESNGNSSIFTALKSIGLELVSKKVAVKILNVDSVAKPSEN